MPLTIPNTISNGITADGNEIGANFTAIQAWATSTDAGVEGVIPPGAISMFGAAAAPAGFLLCDGTAVSRATYADLFTTIGEVYGVGDGSTTFNLPNLASRFPRGGTPGTTGGSADSVVVQHDHTASSGNQSTSHSHTATSGNQSTNHSHSVSSLSVDIDHDHGSTGTDGNHAHTVDLGPYTDSYRFLVPNARPSVTNKTTVSAPDVAGNQWAVGNIQDFSTTGTANHAHDIANYNVSNRSVSGTLGNQSASHSHTITVGNQSASHSHTVTVASVGESGSGKNLPPYQNVQFIIKY